MEVGKFDKSHEIIKKVGCLVAYFIREHYVMARRHFAQLLEISDVKIDAWLVAKQSDIVSYEFWWH